MSLSEGRRLLRGSEAAASWMHQVGLRLATLEMLGVGLQGQTGTTLTLVYPRWGDAGDSTLGRIAVSPAGVEGDRGPPSAAWSTPPYDGADVVVCSDPVLLWLVVQAVGSAALTPLLLVSRSHPAGVPPRWKDEEYWSRFGSVTLLLDDLDKPDELRGVLATMPGLDVGAVTPLRGAAGWRQYLAGSLDATARIELRAALEEPPALCDIVAADGRASMGRADAGSATIHDLDSRGRLRRLMSIEERHAFGRPGGDGCRTGMLVVRSDRRILTVGPVQSPGGTPRSERVIALSDGDRLAELPRRGASALWTLRSAETWVAGGRSEDGDRLLSDVASILRASGFADDAAAVAAAFVMLSYVYPALSQLPLLVITARSIPARLAAARLMAALCLGGRLVGPSRARALARLADETGGTLVLHEPGPLQGPSGLTEAGRFVLSSLCAGASGEHAMDEGGSRQLRVFGPRVVCAARREAIDWPDLLSIELSQTATSAPVHLGAVPQPLLDRLHVWSMETVGRFVEASARLEDGRAAIAMLAPAPSFAVVTAFGEDPSQPASPARVLEDALAAVRSRTGGVVSIVELTLEAALAGGEGEAFTPERIGRWLARSGKVDLQSGVERRRLFGHITRLYALEQTAVEAEVPSDPLSFCKRQLCPACRFDEPCARLFPDLNAARRRAN